MLTQVIALDIILFTFLQQMMSCTAVCVFNIIKQLVNEEKSENGVPNFCRDLVRANNINENNRIQIRI